MADSKYSKNIKRNVLAVLSKNTKLHKGHSDNRYKSQIF